MEAIAQRPVVGRHYDNSPLRIGNAIEIANPHEKGYGTTRYLFAFGQVGCTFVVAYGYTLEDALESAAEYLLEHRYLGHITPHDAPRDDLCCDCADPFECESHTYTESGWLTSHEWNVREDVTNDELRAIHRA